MSPIYFDCFHQHVQNLICSFMCGRSNSVSEEMIIVVRFTVELGDSFVYMDQNIPCISSFNIYFLESYIYKKKIELTKKLMYLNKILDNIHQF